MSRRGSFAQPQSCQSMVFNRLVGKFQNAEEILALGHRYLLPFLRSRAVGHRLERSLARLRQDFINTSGKGKCIENTAAVHISKAVLASHVSNGGVLGDPLPLRGEEVSASDASEKHYRGGVFVHVKNMTPVFEGLRAPDRCLTEEEHVELTALVKEWDSIRTDPGVYEYWRRATAAASSKPSFSGPAAPAPFKPLSEGCKAREEVLKPSQFVEVWSKVALVPEFKRISREQLTIVAPFPDQPRQLRGGWGQCVGCKVRTGVCIQHMPEGGRKDFVVDMSEQVTAWVDTPCTLR